MKKLFFVLVIGFLMPLFATGQTGGHKGYYFTAQVSESDPCCLYIEGGTSIPNGSNDLWSVEVDGAIYNYENNGKQFLHCVEVNGTYTVNFYVEDELCWSRNVEVTDCKKNCCEAPDVSDLEITPVGIGMVKVCLAEREGCSESEPHFRYREVGTGTWKYFGFGPNCLYLGVDPCTTYEFQGGYWNLDCGQKRIEYSESIEFTTPGDCDPIDPTDPDCCSPFGKSISTIQQSCSSISVIIDGYEECNATFTFMEGIHFEWAGFNISENSYTFKNLDPCEVYDFSVIINQEDCENSQVLKIKDISFEDNCCNGFDDSSNASQNKLLEGIESNYNLSTSPVNSILSYPNPFQSSFEINFTSELSENYKLYLFDTQGKLVEKQEGITQKGVNTIEMTGLDNLSKGIYIYKLKSGHKVHTNKISKL